MKNKFFNQCLVIDSSNNLFFKNYSSHLLKFFFLFVTLIGISSKIFAQDDVQYDILDQQAELKRVCWPQVSTSKTEATTNKMKTDTIPIPGLPLSSPGPSSPSGGLSITRRLYNAVEIPNSFPNPDTAEIFDLLGHPLVINGDTIRFTPDNSAANNVANIANSFLPAQPNYHWVGYISNPFQPDRIAEYYYNIFHRWYEGMPCHYESYGGRQWNSDNTTFANYADTVFQAYPVFASIVQSISCYGANNGVIKFNTNPLNYYTFSINGSSATTNNTFSNLGAGTYTLSIKDSFNNVCDTIITLAQPPSTGSSTTVTNCGAFTWNKNGVTYNTSGTYFFTSTTATACPQQDTLILNITSSTTSNITVTAYNSFTWSVNGLTYTTSGTYFNSTTVASGCQTNTILHLTIIYSSFNVNLLLDQPISCNGSHDGSIQASPSPAAGNYTYILDGGVAVNNTGFFGNLGPGTHTVCVSNGTASVSVCKTISLNEPLPLTISFVTDSLVSCQGNDGGVHAIITGGTTLIQPYLTTWSNISGSILNATNNYATSLTGLSVGLYHLHIEDDHGCTLSSNYLMQSAPALSVTATFNPIVCNGGSTTIHASSVGGIPPITYSVNGLPISSSLTTGTYTLTATDAQGCTATTLVTLPEPDPITSYMEATACNSYYWSMNGTTYTASGFYVAFLSTINSCDIMAILNLTINNSSTNTLNITACDTFHWNVSNITYSVSGTYTYTSLNASGCTNTSTLNLTINHTSSSSFNAVACNSYNWTAIGATNPYTTSGNYTATHLNSSGCVHRDTLHLTINLNTSSTQNISACNSYTWNTPSGSSTYTLSGTYTKTSLNSSGCVHTSILNLTIKNSSSSTTTITANNSYTWNANNITYTNTGVYTATLVNAVGCDSLLTLNLTINTTPVVINLRCFFQGYMNGSNSMQPVLANQLQPTTTNACDTIVVQLHQSVPPFNTVFSTKTVMNQSGFSTSIFPTISGSFYIVVRHRNALQTWSSNPVFVGGNPVTYDFTTAANKAYGDNQFQVSPNAWAFYSGDVNKDDNMDLIDIGLVEADVSNFESGYFATDVNGDGSVDLLDLPYVENNALDFIYTEQP